MYGAAQRTPEIADIVNELLAQPGWAAGNDLAFTIVHTCPPTGYGSGCDQCASHRHRSPLHVCVPVDLPATYGCQCGGGHRNSACAKTTAAAQT